MFICLQACICGSAAFGREERTDEETERETLTGLRGATGGAMAHVDDDEIRAGIELLARTTGVFAETAGGVTTAVCKKLVESGRLDPSRETVLYNTGDGLKTLDAIAGRVAPTAVIAPTLKGMRAAGLL